MTLVRLVKINIRLFQYLNITANDWEIALGKFKSAIFIIYAHFVTNDAEHFH